MHVVSSLGIGGAEQVAINLATEHAKAASVMIVSLVKLSKDSAEVGELNRRNLRENHVKVAELNSWWIKTSPLQCLVPLLRIIRKFRPSIIHSHTDIPDLCVSLARRLVAFSIARTIHNTALWPTRPWSGLICERGFRDDLVVGINEPCLAAYRALRRRCDLSESRFQTLIKNGIWPVPDDQRFSRARLIEFAGLDSSKLLMGFVGRLEEQKGLDILLGALARLPASYSGRWQLAVIGDGRLRSDLEAFAKSKRLPVRFLGAVPAASRLLSGFDLLVAPSRHEGAPLVGLEGQFVNVPVLISDVPGLRDTFPPHWPLTFEPENTSHLCAKIVEFSEKPWSKELVNKEIGSWKDQFHAKIMAEKYMSAYHEYLGLTAK